MGGVAVIPRRAFVTFHGEMSWLRKLSLETFRALNPGWGLEVFELPALDDFPSMITAQRSDLIRYRELAEHGGLYFDTDMVWLKPIPEEWLEYDVGITIDPITRFSNIGVLMSSPDNRFWRDVVAGAVKRYRQAANKFAYQLLGICMLNRMFWKELMLVSENEYEGAFDGVAGLYPELRFMNFHEHAICPIPWTVIHKLYKDIPFNLPKASLGVHWFGGHNDSKAFDRRVNESNIDSETCYLAQAVKEALSLARPTAA